MRGRFEGRAEGVAAVLRCRLRDGGESRPARRSRARCCRDLWPQCRARYPGGLEARRVVSLKPRPASASPSTPARSPTRCISALAVSWGRWLRYATSRIVRLGSHEVHGRAQSLDECRQPSARRRTPDHRPTSGSTAGRRTDPARGVQPPDGRAGQRMSADERQTRRQRRAASGDLPLRAADVGHDCFARHVGRERRQEPELARTGAARTIRSASAASSRCSPPTSADCMRMAVSITVLAIHGDEPGRRPPLRTASAIEAPMRPKPDDRDALEGGGSSTRASASAARLVRLLYTPHPRRATGSRQMLRPIAGAMIRSSAISRSNCAGNIDCAPSLSA